MSHPNVPPTEPQSDTARDQQNDADQGVIDVANELSEQEGASDVEQLEAELRQAQSQIARAQADLENYRKRVRRDTAEQHKYADLSLLRDLLPVVDNFDLALNSLESSENNASLLEGVKMVADQLMSVLQQHDCQRIEAEGKIFDPNLHEAVAQQPSGDHPQGTVVGVIKAGYRLHDRVIRPAQVVVSTDAADAE